LSIHNLHPDGGRTPPQPAVRNGLLTYKLQAFGPGRNIGLRTKVGTGFHSFRATIGLPGGAIALPQVWAYAEFRGTYRFWQWKT
jgi:hypothetical protein